jgi:ribosomal protein S27AE
MFVVVFLAVFPIGLISQPLWRDRFLCPRCHVDLVKLDSQLDPQDLATRLRDAFLRHEVRKQFWERRNACPQCGLSFDGPYPSK